MIQRISKRELAAKTLLRSGCGRLMQRVGSWRGLLVLNYHRVGDGRHSLFDRNLWSASSEDFDAQIATVVRDFDVIGLEDLQDVWQKRTGRYVLITFDDGYLDNYLEAFPILKRHNAKAVFFLTTGFLDVPQIPWWDEIAWMVRTSPLQVLPPCRWFEQPISLDDPDHEQAIHALLRTYKRLPGDAVIEFMDDLSRMVQSPRCPAQVAHELWMTWPMVREMQQSGMAMGGHTTNHPILANLTAERQDKEVRICQQRLTHELGRPATAFSYPVGGRNSFNADTRAALQRHGFEWGFTFVGGHARLPMTDRFAIPRAAIETDVNRPLFHAILTLPHWFS